MNMIQMVVSWGFFGPIFMFQHEINVLMFGGFLNSQLFWDIENDMFGKSLSLNH